MARPLALSIVVPCYREARRVQRTATVLAEYFRKRRGPFEIILVNDGSPDATEREARAAARRLREVRVLSYARNRGKGHALRKGILAARGKRLLFLDADLSTKPDQFPKLETRLINGADIAIGSRKMKGAHLVRRQPWWRENMGKVFTGLVRRLLVDVSDVTCGFKAMRTDVAKELFSKQVLNDWSFDAEVLFLAERSGYRIDEVPVVWKDNPDSHVRVLSAALASLKGLMLIRWNVARGQYGRLDRPAV